MADDPPYISSVPVPGFEVPGQTRTYVVAQWSTSSTRDRLRYGSYFVMNAFQWTQERAIEFATEMQMDRFANEIADHVATGRVGFLIRMNLVQDDAGTRPAADAFTMIGRGIEPIDALAEFYRAPQIQTTSATTARYFWCYRRGEDMALSCLNEVGGPIEKLASVEARRRNLVASIVAIDPATSIQRIQRAEFWQQVASERLRLVQNRARAERIVQLNRHFEETQNRMNEAYRAYQIAAAAIAEQNSELAFLGKISTVLSVIQSGMNAYNLVSSEISSGAPDSAEWRQHQIQVLENASKDYSKSFEDFQGRLRQLETEMQNLYRIENIPVPDSSFPTIILG